MTNEKTTLLAGLALGGTIVAVVLVVLLLIYIVTCIGYAKMFQKAGEAGWKAYVPVYNTYVLFKKCWSTKMFWMTVVLSVVSGIVDRISSDNAMLGLVSAVLAIVAIVIQIMGCRRISRAYGRKTGTAIGLFFLPTIFSWILGFGSAEYTGNGEA